MALLASTNSSVLVGLSAVTLVVGYGLLWMMWRFVFSSRNEHADTADRARRDKATAELRDPAQRDRA